MGQRRHSNSSSSLSHSSSGSGCHDAEVHEFPAAPPHGAGCAAACSIQPEVRPFQPPTHRGSSSCSSFGVPGPPQDALPAGLLLASEQGRLWQTMNAEVAAAASKTDLLQRQLDLLQAAGATSPAAAASTGRPRLLGGRPAGRRGDDSDSDGSDGELHTKKQQAAARMQRRACLMQYMAVQHNWRARLLAASTTRCGVLWLCQCTAARSAPRCVSHSAGSCVRVQGRRGGCRGTVAAGDELLGGEPRLALPAVVAPARGGSR
jgi:hypothetical protein